MKTFCMSYRIVADSRYLFPPMSKIVTPFFKKSADLKSALTSFGVWYSFFRMIARQTFSGFSASGWSAPNAVSLLSVMILSTGLLGCLVQNSHTTRVVLPLW